MFGPDGDGSVEPCAGLRPIFPLPAVATSVENKAHVRSHPVKVIHGAVAGEPALSKTFQDAGKKRPSAARGRVPCR